MSDMTADLCRRLAEAITSQIDATNNARALLSELTTTARFNLYISGLECRLAERERQLKQANGLLSRAQRNFKLVSASFMFGVTPNENTPEGERAIEAIVELHDCSTGMANYWYSNVQGATDASVE